MCDACEELPATYVAYFNKAGRGRWRPAPVVPAEPVAIDPRAAGAEWAAVPVTVREVRHFCCDDPQDRSSARTGAV